MYRKSSELAALSFDRNRILRSIRCLTQHAADKWDSARFQAVISASAGFRFRACFSPAAGNAHR